jgi:hypothetical protein
MNDELINPISQIQISDENREEVERLMSDFEKLSPEEKVDVIELQNLMLEFASKHNKEYGIPEYTDKVDRTPNEIINQMSKQSLDYSQMCLKYYVSQLADKMPKK